MGKLQDKLSSQKGLIADIYSRYLVTICAFGLICLLGIVENNIDRAAGDSLEHAFLILAVLGVGSLLVESLVQSLQEQKRVKVRVVGCVAAGVLAIIWDIIARLIEDKPYDLAQSVIERVFIAYMYTLGFLAVYCIIKNTGLSLQAYGRTAIFNLIKMFFTFGAINLGCLLILFMFDALLFSLDIWDWIENIELLITAVVYIPYALICLTDKKADESRFKKGFLRAALMPMVVAATVIIYAYIIKIILGGKTSNEIFGTCALLFAIGAPIWEMANYEGGSDEQEVQKASLWNRIIINMPYIYAPFILLEIYAIGSRIIQYGLTPDRYFAIVFIIFQLIYVGWKWIHRYIIKSEGNGKEMLIPVGLGLVLIALLCPFFNFSYSCYASQKGRLNRYYADINKLVEAVDENALEYGNLSLSDEERRKVHTFVGAYDYLISDVRGEKYINKQYGKKALKEKVATLKLAYNYNIYDYRNDNDDKPHAAWDHFGYDSGMHGVDISGGYTKIYMASFDENYSDEYDLEHYGALEINYDNGKKYVTVDARDVIKQLLADDSEYGYGDEIEPYIIDITEDKRLIITYIGIYKQQGAPIYKSMRITGYILER